MKENLRGIYRSENGSSDFIANGGGWPNSASTLSSNTTPYWYNPYNESISVQSNDYGHLYNWAAVINRDTDNPEGARGLCPNGWHVPTFSEWTQLLDYLSGYEYEYSCDNTSANIAKALSSRNYWSSSTNPCAVGNNPSSNNVTGFSAVPAGLFAPNTQRVANVNEFAIFWTSTQTDNNNAIRISISYADATVNHQSSNKAVGASVRCVRD